jgi:hypothetical protein
LRRGWTPSSHGVNLKLRQAPESQLHFKATSAKEFFRGGLATAKIVGLRLHLNGHLTKRSSEPSKMEKPSDSDCFGTLANDPSAMPSLPLGTGSKIKQNRVRFRGAYRSFAVAILIAGFLAGCENSTPEKPAAETKPTAPAAPAVPEDVQSAADALLGTETTVLLFGELAKNGKQQFLAANVVPKSTKNNLPGTIVTRAVVAENDDGKWTELLRCDEHLKNQKGFLPGTPIGGVTGWRLAYEQDPEKGLAMYFTPLKGAVDTHTLPIGIRWNAETKRYQSLDRSYEHFLNESPSLNTARSSLR